LDTSIYGQGDDAYPYVFERDMSIFFAKWGLLSLVREMEARLISLRDAELGLGRQSAANALSRLRLMTLESADVSAIAQDFGDMSKIQSPKNAPKFVIKRRLKGSPEIDIADWLNEEIANRARNLGRLDATLKSLAIQSGNLLVASQNLRLQRWVGLLTVAALILAAVSAVEPAEKLWSKIRADSEITASKGHPKQSD
jgi:hypothetical protein